MDIARQLVETDPGRNANVVLGGGYVMFKTKNYTSDKLDEWTCQRSDGRDLIQDWLDYKAGSGIFVSNKDELKMAVQNKAKNVFGKARSNQ